MSVELEVGVSGYQSGVLSCTVRHHYQGTTSENTKDLLFAIVICSVQLSESIMIICCYKL
jgi:hypothetical protein